MAANPPDFLALPPTHLLPEWRQNPITGAWVIIAPERGTRPSESPGSPAFPPLFESCPFCAGHEQHTPPELFAVRAAGSHVNQPGWRVRVVPNRYPAVRDFAFAPEADKHAGFGKHELVIESPHHDLELAHLLPGQVQDVVTAWRERLRALSHDDRLKYAHVFKNQGTAAGASVAHCHSQIIALPFVPPFLQQELDAGQTYHARHERCIFCDLLHAERAARSRIVWESPRYLAVVAYAGRQPYETWILPRQHQCRFETINAEETAELGTMLWQVLSKLQQVIDRLSYNVILHTAPFHEGPLPHFHWHLEVLPRISQAAGFEWGTGVYINIVRPEDAAERLRNCP